MLDFGCFSHYVYHKISLLMLVIQVCTFLVFWDLGYKIEFLCVFW